MNTMGERTDESKKWKSSLLRTSLPLEIVVEGILRDQGLFVIGEFPYLRPKDTGIEAEFSVDAWARSQFAANSQMTLHILVECKYVTPGAAWIFSPLPALVEKQATGLQSHLLTVIDETSPFRIGPDGIKGLNTFGAGFEFVSKGVAAREQSFEPDSIRHGIYQMRFALPNLVAADMRMRTGLLGAFHQRVAVICGIVVTTAPIRILKASAGLKDYMAADCLEDISDAADVVILWQFLSPEVIKYCRMLCGDLRKEGAAWDQLVKWRAKLIQDEERWPEIDQLLEYRFIESTQRIAIVHLDALPDFLENLLETISAAKPYVEFLMV
jgi:hypothetical protein